MGNDAVEQQICPPTLADVREATILCDQVIKTPLLENPEVNGLLSGRLLIKAETAQRTGAFKFRGAYNRICQMDEAQKERGVIAYSSGNHAQARAAVGLATVLSRKIDINNRAIAVIATGDNVDATDYCAALSKTEK